MAMTRLYFWSSSLPFLVFLSLVAGATSHGGSCPNSAVKPFDPLRHKKLYRVGVLAIRGIENAYLEFNQTFQTYLTMTAGQMFDEPITFEMRPLDFTTVYTDVEAKEVDFIYVNPSAFSCLESEFTAYSLVSQISRREVLDEVYNLKKFGGVIAARADNHEINHISDLKDKVVAAASISGLGSGQMQFLAMKNAGMSYINDPKQLVFTSNQGKVVRGVLDGSFDVGFIRTDQIEQTTDADGNLLNASLFKVIDPLSNLTIDGVPFPFESSTELYPEWNVAALSHVAEDVSREVQNALLALADHAVVGRGYRDCLNRTNASACEALLFPDDFSPDSFVPRCDTTLNISQVAVDASESGGFSAWQTTLSYMQLRSLLEAVGFISEDPETNLWKCIRSQEVYDIVTCPDGFYKESKQVVEQQCGRKGLGCGEGFQCICSPCVAILQCNNAVEIRGHCVPYYVLLPSILVPFFVVILVTVHFYVEYRRKQADSVWAVRPKDLLFSDPPTILGVGTFGLVLLAEYRGTNVAVKRVIPPSNSHRMKRFDNSSETTCESYDIECNPGLKTMSPRVLRSVRRFGSLEMTGKKRTQSQMKADFVHEMRHLAKLRHPCVTTVMGAVISHTDEPMLVMEYMELGSLKDVLRNKTLEADVDENLMQILQDIAQGMRFLHAADPQVIHGDLKARNVLVDTNFRAKVTDFGLSAKRTFGASGTPFWMAPELLRGESTNTSKSDMYAFGVLLYEVFSRKDPYEGEDHDEVLKQICDPMINKCVPVPSQCTGRVAILMQECLSPDPDERPTAEQIDLSLRVEGGVKERTNRLEKLNRELAEANEKIASASALQLQHFACMSHEIRTPLNCIVGISSLMEDSRELTANQQENVNMIATSGRLLQHIVDDVLDYSKLESGNAEVDIKQADLQEIISAVVQSMTASAIAKRKNVKIQTYFDFSVKRHLITDGRRLSQILYNLFSNAIKFSKQDGVVELWMTARSSNRQVRFASEEEEKQPLVEETSKVLRISVKDYGKGIDKSEFIKIFQPFAQTISGIRNTEGGTGLGLAITKKLVEALGGSISVNSQVGKWTQFTIELPLDCKTNDIPVSTITRLATTEVVLVSGEEMEIQQRLDSVLRHCGIRHSRVSSMAAMEQNISRGGYSYVCMVMEDLFDGRSFQRLCQKAHVGLVTIGPKNNVADASLHYNSLMQLFPSVLIQDLCDLVEGARRMERSPSVASSQTSSLENLKVLVAEDNLVNQKVFRRLLTRIGVTDVEIVEDGDIAVAREAEVPFDVILMDMQMPRMDGVEATKQILNRQGGHAKPKIIFVTAHVSESFRHQCMGVGAIAYLPKPCTIDSLRGTLERVVFSVDAANDCAV